MTGFLLLGHDRGDGGFLGVPDRGWNGAVISPCAISMVLGNVTVDRRGHPLGVLGRSDGGGEKCGEHSHGNDTHVLFSYLRAVSSCPDDLFKHKMLRRIMLISHVHPNTNAIGLIRVIDLINEQ